MDGLRRSRENSDYVAWLHQLFPVLEKSRSRQPPQKSPDSWTEEALSVAQSLLRNSSLAKLDGGIELQRTVTEFDPRWKRRSSRATEFVLFSPTSWMTRPVSPNGDTLINFCDANERGVYSRAFQLGRLRKSGVRP